MRRLLLIGGGCIGICIFCIVLSMIGSALGILPDVNATSTAEAQASANLNSTDVAIANATATIIALTPSSTPTETPIPTRTLPPSNTPRPTNTIEAAISNTATLTALESNLYEIEGVQFVRMSSLRDMDNGVLGYLEIDTHQGLNTEAMAQQLYQQTLTQAIATYGSANVNPFEFSVIIWDGNSPATHWLWDNDTDQWESSLVGAQPDATITPASSGSTSQSLIGAPTQIQPQATSTRTPADFAEFIVKNTHDTRMGDSDVRNFALNEDTKVIVLRFAMDEALTVSMYRDYADTDMLLIACSLMANGFTSYDFWFTATAPGTNSFGEDIEIEAVEVELSADAASRVNCNNLSAVVLENIATRYDLSAELIE
jgi:hypothetical protein